MGVDDLQDFAKISDAHAEAIRELTTAAETLTIREDQLQSKITKARHFLFEASKNIDIGRPRDTGNTQISLLGTRCDGRRTRRLHRPTDRRMPYRQGAPPPVDDIITAAGD